MGGDACNPRKKLRRWLSSVAACLSMSCLSTLLPAHAQAQIGSARYSSIIIDESSGNVLEDVNPDEPRHPASLPAIPQSIAKPPLTWSVAPVV